MTSIIETGHAKNVAVFDEILIYLTGFGKDYSPSKASLAIEALNGTCTSCKNAMYAVRTSNIGYKNAVDARELAFSQVSKLVTRVINTLKASDVPPVSVQTALAAARKIQGRRAKPKRTDEEKKADVEAGIDYREISASQRSFDSIIENFSFLTELLLNVSGYKPNEKDLQTESLKALIEDLKQKNSAAVSAQSALFDARARRNDLLYKKETGLVDIAMDIKAYVKGAFGSESPQFKKISGLEFKRN